MAQIPPKVKPVVEAARRAIKSAGPAGREIDYAMKRPQSSRMMWKLYRYADASGNVCGIGVFPDHANLFFYRGRDLDDGSGLLQGSGREMRSITLRSATEVTRPAVRNLLRKAFELGG
jgi:hypothetical protein